MTEVVLDPTAWKDVEPGTEALVERWLVQEGDRVRAGQTVAVVVLVKASIDVPAPIDGTIDRILVPQDDTFGPGRPLAQLSPG